MVDKNYYLCLDAVWFISTAATGPWKICTAVPPVIYTIPPSSPVHRVTYVKVETTSEPDVVVCSYTAGYNGAFVAGMAIGAALVWGKAPASLLGIGAEAMKLVKPQEGALAVKDVPTALTPSRRTTVS